MDIDTPTMAQAVTVSLQELVDGEWLKQKNERILIYAGTVSFDTLTAAFGPASLGIIVVKDLPTAFTELRAKVLSNSSYLAALPDAELGM
jgi:hypothetical protein